jgi:hypothetical protein
MKKLQCVYVCAVPVVKYCTNFLKMSRRDMAMQAVVPNCSTCGFWVDPIKMLKLVIYSLTNDNFVVFSALISGA